MPLLRSPIKRPGAFNQWPPLTPPSPQYRAPAVNFNGATVLNAIIRGPVAPSPLFSFAGWFNTIWHGPAVGGTFPEQIAFLIDPLGSQTPFLLGSTSTPGGSTPNPQHFTGFVGGQAGFDNLLPAFQLASYTFDTALAQAQAQHAFQAALQAVPNGFYYTTLNTYGLIGTQIQTALNNIASGHQSGINDIYVTEYADPMDDPSTRTTIFYDVNGIEISQATNKSPATPGSWQHLMGTIDLGAGLGVMAFGDSQITISFSPQASINIESLPIYVGGDNGLPANNYIGGMSELYIKYGVSFMDNTGTIPEKIRRLFINNKGAPVDPAASASLTNPSGGVLTSETFKFPSVFLHGDRNTFVGNAQGTSGPFSVLAGALTNAPTSPSDAFA